jgi:DNA-binding CsgD family transcriptional regulator
MSGPGASPIMGAWRTRGGAPRRPAHGTAGPSSRRPGPSRSSSRRSRAWSEGATLAPDQAVAYVTRARGARGRPSSGWPSLTPTELEIVALAVDGLTNPEIGACLLISRNTVKTHLGHVYAKLGVANRTELATLASERPTSRS